MLINFYFLFINKILFNEGRFLALNQSLSRVRKTSPLPKNLKSEEKKTAAKCRNAYEYLYDIVTVYITSNDVVMKPY